MQLSRIANQNPQSAKIISAKFCKRPICENFVPRKFGAIRMTGREALKCSVPAACKRCNNQVYREHADLSESLLPFWHRYRESDWNKLATATSAASETR